MGKLKNVVDKQVLTNHLVEERITMKLDYLSNSQEQDELVKEFNAKKWLTFLPPLIDVNTEGVQIGSTFRENLMRSIQQGNIDQFKLMNILSGRMTLFSMKIQEKSRL